MTRQETEHLFRILIVDDMASLHEDFHKILSPSETNQDLDAAIELVLGKDAGRGRCRVNHPRYELDSAYQGQEALQLVRQSIKQESLYAMAFVDMRMPPGLDGVQTIKGIWELDPNLQIVLCTAYTDYKWEDLIEMFGNTDRLLILKKPFDHLEVLQLANALTQKWRLARELKIKFDELDRRVRERTRALEAANQRLVEEVEQRRKTEDAIRHNALHDPLTMLPNRTMLMERLKLCVERSKREKEYHFAVLFLDMDEFKVVNDSLGHRAGDELLKGIAERLSSCLRAIDATCRPGADTTARMGGDEFVILLDGLRQPSDAILVAERIQEALSKPFDIEGHDLVAGMSVGVAMNHPDATLPEDILRDADTALYQAKQNGKRQFAIFDVAMRERAVARMQIETNLRKALEREEFHLEYQPIVCLESGELEGFEALLRWDYPGDRVVGPDEFIPIAEETGLIVPIGLWVLNEACRQAQAWTKHRTPDRPLTISVNLSARQIYAMDVLEQIDDILHATGLDPRRLKLEITETAIIDKTHELEHLFESCANRGIAFHIDDFGTGYSALSYLHLLPISAIKIDRSFIKDLSFSSEHAATIMAVVTLANSRNMRVIAEGIETVDQLAQLQSLNCDLGQGYYFSRPLTAKAAEAYILAPHQYSISI